MINLLKHEIKNKSMLLIISLSLYILEHIFISFKLYGHSQEEIFVGVTINIISTTIFFTGIIFLNSLIDFNTHLKPKPGYMIFMANITRKSFILTKLGIIFIEPFLIGLIALISFFLQIFLLLHPDFLDFIHSHLSFSYEGDSLIYFYHLVKLLFYISTSYLTIITVFMFAITLKTFLLKGKKFGSILTVLITFFLLFIRGNIYKSFNIKLLDSFDTNLPYEKISNISNGALVTNIGFSIIIIFLIIYLVEKKLEI